MMLPIRIDFNEFEQDALRELFNLGIGRAADALSRMVKDEVRFTVPHMEVLDRTHATRFLRDHTQDEVAAIRQLFRGHFHGMAMLVYPELQSLELVRSLLGEYTPLDDLSEMEQESLLDVGNVILNSCLGIFANMMNLELRSDMPEYLKGSWDDLLPSSAPFGDMEPNNPNIVILVVDFIAGKQSTTKKSIKGFVMLLLGFDSIDKLKKSIANMGEPKP